MSSDTVKRLSPYLEKILGWILVTLIALYGTTEVVKAKMDDVNSWRVSHTEEHQQRDAEMVTKREFDQFRSDTKDQLNRIQNSLEDINKELRRRR